MATFVVGGQQQLVTSPASSVSSLHPYTAEGSSSRPLGHAASSSIASTGSATTSSASSSVISTPSVSSQASVDDSMSHPAAGPVSPSNGAKIKRVLAGARRKVASRKASNGGGGGDDGMTSADEGYLSVAQRAARWGTQVRANTGPPLSKLGHAVFGRSKSKESVAAAAAAAIPHSPPPPPLPPKLRSNGLDPHYHQSGDSPIATSPGISAALQYMHDTTTQPVAVSSGSGSEARDQVTPTHSAIRRTAATTDPAAAASRRTSVAATIRPVSGAPSIATITPNDNDDDNDSNDQHGISVSASTVHPVHAIIVNDPAPSSTSDTPDSRRHAIPLAPAGAPRQHHTQDLPFAHAPPPSAFTPTPSAATPTKQQKRRSMSLDFTHIIKASSTPSVSSWQASIQTSPPPGLAPSPGTVSSASLITRDIGGIIGPSASSGAASSGHATDTGGGRSFRERLGALNLANSNAQPSPPPSHPFRRHIGQQSLAAPRPPTVFSPSPPARRPNAVSMTQSIQQSIGGGAAAASGLALGLGKRAYDRVGKLWSGGDINTAGAQQHATPPQKSPRAFGRVRSNDSTNVLGSASDREKDGNVTSSSSSKKNGGLRRTPNAPSGAWSISSMGLSSDDDASAGRVAADLGPCLRAAKAHHGNGGLVFGRVLAECVKETRIVPRVPIDQPKRGVAKDIEARLLPALIVRCVQHLRTWGVEEEGLFRISGRASHIAKLRIAFDTGADYNLKEAGPGQLDPHAVASSFKAYLRELPEPILTRSLSIRFDEVVASSPTTQTKQTQEFYGLSDGPGGRSIPQMRKPPSLSNLGPACNASPALLHRLSVLIARLPQENRDLLYTVIELLKTTAANVKNTKMPMANLLLLFCPSLQVSPAILKLLCEAEGVWDGPLPAPPLQEDDDDDEPEEVIDLAMSPVSEEGPSMETFPQQPPQRSRPQPTPPRQRQVVGPGIGSLEGGPRRRVLADASRSPVPGLSPGDFSKDMFTVTPLTTPTPPLSEPSSTSSPYFHFSPPPSSAATSSPSKISSPAASAMVSPIDKAAAPPPRTPSARSQEEGGNGGSVKRRLSLFGLGGGSGRNSSAGSSTGNLVDDNSAPPSPSTQGRRRLVSRPSLQLMFSNRRSAADLLASPPSPERRSSTAAEPPVLALPTVGSPTFSASLESIMCQPEDSSQQQHQEPNTSLLAKSASSTNESGRDLMIPSSRSRSPSPALIQSVAAQQTFSSPFQTPQRPASPGPAVALGSHSRSPKEASSPSESKRARTPIADMFRSPSRLALLEQDNDDDDDDDQVVYLPPIAFSGSPVFRVTSPTASTGAQPTTFAQAQSTGLVSPPPRLDVRLSREQRQAVAAGLDDEGDWSRLVLAAGRTGTDGRPPRGALNT